MYVQILPITDVDFSAISPRNLLIQSGERKWANIYSTAFKHWVQFSSVQSLSRVRLFETPWVAARQASLSITNSQSLLKFMPVESVMPSSHLILCHPLLLLPPIPPSIRVFSNESTLVVYIESQLNPWVAGDLRLILHLSNLVEIVS